MRKSLNFIWQILFLLLAFLLGTIVSSGLALVVSSFGIDICSADNQLWIQFVNQVLSFGFAAWVYALYFRYEPVSLFQLCCRPNTLLLALIGIVAMLCLLPAIDWVTVWNDGMHLAGEWGKALEKSLRAISAMSVQLLQSLLCRTDVLHLVLNIFVLALVPAICEELFFRGAMQNIFVQWCGSKHCAVVITAVIFSLAHGDIFAFFPRFFLGVLLGYLFLYSGSLLVSSLAHFANNLVVVVFNYLSAKGVVDIDPDSPLCISWVATAATLLLSAALLYLFFKMCRREDSDKTNKNQI